MKDKFLYLAIHIIAASVIFAFVALIGYAVMLVAQEVKPSIKKGPRPEPAYQIGQVVKLKAFPDINGMVIRQVCQEGGLLCSYTLRIRQNSASTNVGLLGLGHEVIDQSPLSKIHVSEYEIE